MFHSIPFYRQKSGLSLRTTRDGIVLRSVPKYSIKGVISITREADIQNQIRIALAPYAIIFRVNSGKVRMADGRYFDTGVPNGYSDLSGFRKSDGKAIFLEIKNEKGRLRPEQKKFLETMQKYDVIAGVARSETEAVKLVLEG